MPDLPFPSWLKGVEEKLKDGFHRPIQTKTLAAMVEVHPVYLARIFRRHYGCSIKTYLQNLRLEKALQDLSDGKKSIVDIALDAGFSDQSHLNRSLKKSINISPGIFRKWAAEVSFVQD